MHPTRVYLLRHAETADPTVFHGAESDIGLSARGMVQASAVAGVLAALRPALVVSSAMLRARLTAEPIAHACGVPHAIEPDLHERRVAGLSLHPFDALDNVWGATVRHWMAGDTAFANPGAESYDDLRARVLPVWQRLTRDHAGATFVIVAHGVVCKVLLATLLPEFGVAGWQRLGPIDNAAITELVHDGERWRAVRLNDKMHEYERVSDLIEHLNVPPQRIFLQPPPGTATEADVVKRKCCELIDGTLVELALGWYESALAVVLAYRLGKYLDKHDLGITFGAGGGVRVRPGRVRNAQLVFLSWDHFPGRLLPREDIMPFVPEFVAWIWNSDNTPEELDRKRRDYFDGGTRMIWEIDPDGQIGKVYTSPKRFTTVDIDGTLDGGDVLPGFTLKLRDCFERLGARR